MKYEWNINKKQKVIWFLDFLYIRGSYLKFELKKLAKMKLMSIKGINNTKTRMLLL